MPAPPQTGPTSVVGLDTKKFYILHSLPRKVLRPSDYKSYYYSTQVLLSPPLETGRRWVLSLVWLTFLILLQLLLLQLLLPWPSTVAPSISTTKACRIFGWEGRPAPPPSTTRQNKVTLSLCGCLLSPWWLTARLTNYSFTFSACVVRWVDRCIQMRSGEPQVISWHRDQVQQQVGLFCFMRRGPERGTSQVNCAGKFWVVVTFGLLFMKTWQENWVL